MIKKILKIKNLGRLNIPIGDDVSDENKNDDFSFKKNTLIFGENTYGKTTLVSVFKSLQTGESLDSRKKFKSLDPIQIKIEEVGNDGATRSYEYGKDTWENNNVLIFDNDFIKDNIFSEDQIKGEHLKSLPKVLIGDGVKKDVDQIGSIIKCDSGACSDCEFCINNALTRHKSTLNRSYHFEQFSNISTKIPNIDQKIKEKETALSVDENLVDLKNQSRASGFYNIDIEAIESLFDKKINSAFQAAVERHLSENTNNLEKAKGFLGYGLKLKKGDICPFCSQDTTDVQDFINSLSRYFDKEYTQFKDEIEKCVKSFAAFDLEKEQLSFSKLNFSPIEEPFDKGVFEVAFANVKSKMEQKKEDLNFDCDFENDEDFKLVKSVFQASRKLLTGVIEKQALSYLEKATLNRELASYLLNKYRFSTEGSAFFDEYQRIERKLKSKNASKKTAQDALVKKVNELFELNRGDINAFLKGLKADFKITKLKPTVDNRDKNNYLKLSEYAFEFVDLQNESVSVDLAKFKETFSDSDKRLLGFAFFLSVLKNDINLDTRIVILDDPFSSFDINRKEETIKLFDGITNVDGKKPEQKVVFTHEKGFYCQLNKLIVPANKDDKKLLKLNYSKANNGTAFELVDIKKFESDKYYGDLEYINKAIATNNNLDEALPKARECAEYLLRAKYINTLEAYRDKDGNPINFNVNSINSFLAAIDQKCPVKSDLLALELHRFHHSQPQWKTSLSDTSKNQILTDFVGLVEQI